MFDVTAQPEAAAAASSNLLDSNPIRKDNWKELMTDPEIQTIPELLINFCRSNSWSSQKANQTKSGRGRHFDIFYAELATSLLDYLGSSLKEDSHFCHPHFVWIC